MNQSSLIAGALLAGFALFIAARDRLGIYGAILWGDSSGATAPNGDAGASAPPASPTAGAIPGTGDFDPLDILGDYGIGIGDAMTYLPEGFRY